MRHLFDRSTFLILLFVFALLFGQAGFGQSSPGTATPGMTFGQTQLPYETSPMGIPNPNGNPNISPQLNPANPLVTPGITTTPGIIPNETAPRQKPNGRIEDTYPNTVPFTPNLPTY